MGQPVQRKLESNKRIYKITNWKEYNTSLVNRGDITIYINDDVIKNWNNTDIKKKRGGQKIYSDIAIEACFILGLLYKKPLRGTEGFVNSIFKLMKLSIKAPDYTTLSKRAKTLNIKKYKKDINIEGKINVLIDSTGIKISGSREWEVEKWKISKKAKWLKLHIATDEISGEILAYTLTDGHSDDAKEVNELLEQIDRDIDTVKADGAYDEDHIYKLLEKKNVNCLFPPRKDAVLSGSKDNPTIRDWNIKYIKEKGKQAWASKTKYNKRNLVENTMFRYKQLIGDSLKSKNHNAQNMEIAIGINLINQMTALGMPKSKRVLKTDKNGLKTDKKIA